MFEKEQSITKFYVKDFRRFGQPKLKKPKELYRINPAFSVAYNPKCMCQVFIKGNDVWVKHRDYFSPSMCEPEDYGKSLNQLCEKYMGRERPKKFIYEGNSPSLAGSLVAFGDRRREALSNSAAFLGKGSNGTCDN